MLLIGVISNGGVQVPNDIEADLDELDVRPPATVTKDSNSSKSPLSPSTGIRLVPDCVYRRAQNLNLAVDEQLEISR